MDLWKQTYFWIPSYEVDHANDYIDIEGKLGSGVGRKDYPW